MYSTPFQNAKLVLFFQIPKCFGKKKMIFFLLCYKSVYCKREKRCLGKAPFADRYLDVGDRK